MPRRRTEEAPLLPLDFSNNNRKTTERGLSIRSGPGWKLRCTEQLTRGTKIRGGSEATEQNKRFNNSN